MCVGGHMSTPWIPTHSSCTWSSRPLSPLSRMPVYTMATALMMFHSFSFTPNHFNSFTADHQCSYPLNHRFIREKSNTFFTDFFNQQVVSTIEISVYSIIHSLGSQVHISFKSTSHTTNVNEVKRRRRGNILAWTDQI